MGRSVIGVVILFLATAHATRLHAQETDLAKEASAWEYSGAKKHSSAQGGLYLSLSTTEDELAKVVKFYEKKFGTTLELKKAGAGGVEGSADKSTGTINDSFQLGAKNSPPRALSMEVTTQDTKGHCVSVVLSR